MLNRLVHRPNRRRCRQALTIISLSAIVVLAGQTARAADDTMMSPPAPPPLTDEQKIIHVLNRLGYGPRPGDVERIEKMGLPKYLNQQLHPETIDDSALQAELTKYDILTMDDTDLSHMFRDEQQENKERKTEQANMEKQNASTMTDATMSGVATNSTAVSLDKPKRDYRREDGPRKSVLAVAELQNAKIIRAADSPKQLYEVLVDFWSNHFNIDVRKGPCRVLKVVDDREVIRPHVLGKFHDLLEASAKSPAMLHYLDNALNSAPREMSPNEQRRRNQYIQQQNPGAPVEPVSDKPKKAGGINENYAREIMELHTLGVDGGYTQKDV